jgi:hypothetical protein
MIIGTVVEGPTDRIVLEAILRKLIPGDHSFRSLQPPVTFGEIGAGWKGVRRWCRQTWQQPGISLDALLSSAAGQPLDLLVIHVDASIAAEADLQESDDDPVTGIQKPCPPIAPTGAQLRRVIAHWLRQDDLPPKIVLAIPVQDTESWTFAALLPDDELCGRADYECLRAGKNHPGSRLALKKFSKLLRRTDGQIKKHGQSYREIAPQIAAAWETVCRVCGQAAQFTQDIQAVGSYAGQRQSLSGGGTGADERGTDGC